MMLKEAPGGGCTLARCWKMQMDNSQFCRGEENTDPLWFQRKGATVAAHPLHRQQPPSACLPSPGVYVILKRASWNENVTVTLSWAQCQKKQNDVGRGLGKARGSRGGSVTSGQMGLCVQPFRPTAKHFKSPYCVPATV